MSPEQASGGAIDERTDLYALGIVMYEMFTGRVPFEADSYMGVLTKHLYVAPTPPSVLLGEPAELGALEQMILRCLEKKPEKRYPSMVDLAAELRRVATFTDVGELRVQPAELTEPRVRHRLADELELPTSTEIDRALGRRGIGDKQLRPWAAGAAVVGFVFVLAALVSLTRPSPSGPVSSAVSVSGPATPIVTPPPSSKIAVPEQPDPPPTASARDTEEPRSSTRSHSKSTSKNTIKNSNGPAPSAQPPARNPSTAKQKMVGGDIIDPWSQR
jgi:serine/threonine-protein kinase